MTVRTATALIIATGVVLAPVALAAHGVRQPGREAAAIAEPAVGPLLYLGAKHMVTGYDHLLFLAGVVFFVYRPVRQADSGRDRRRSCRRGRPAFRGGPSGGIRDRSALEVDAVELEIAPYDYVEYKYRLAQSAAMLFSWESSAPVLELDQKNSVLTMTTRDKGYPPVVEIDITPKTRIERDGRPTPRTALKRGVHVVSDALGDDVFSLEALTIRIVPAPK